MKAPPCFCVRGSPTKARAAFAPALRVILARTHAPVRKELCIPTTVTAATRVPREQGRRNDSPV